MRKPPYCLRDKENVFGSPRPRAPTTGSVAGVFHVVSVCDLWWLFFLFVFFWLRVRSVFVFCLFCFSVTPSMYKFTQSQMVCTQARKRQTFQGVYIGWLSKWQTHFSLEQLFITITVKIRTWVLEPGHVMGKRVQGRIQAFGRSVRDTQQCSGGGRRPRGDGLGPTWH